MNSQLVGNHKNGRSASKNFKKGSVSNCTIALLFWFSLKKIFDDSNIKQANMFPLSVCQTSGLKV
jgi:hypothetical protein